ncbi:MAG TPA: M23 family metallopeptidase [Xanthomonadales bacterium]|nr:M23 family metallopeptidase [Xanthomonadales bacterium]
MRAIAFALLLLASGQVAAADEAAVMARGRELTATWAGGDTKSVFGQMDPGMQKFVRGEEGFAKFSAGALAGMGKETDVLSETVSESNGYAIYERTSTWSKADGPYVVRWEIGTDGKVGGFGVMPQAGLQPAPSNYLEYATKARLRLPFDGEWMVGNGGRNVEQNLHAVQAQQRFALDLMIARNGTTHAGKGEKLEEYYCWGTPILAPADGVVVATVADQRDNAVGERGGTSPAGNHVIIDLGNDEYAVLAHLQAGSVLVKPGQAVKSGDALGKCGNSGNTTEPHLHFHLQDSPKLGEGGGKPAFFSDYVADGKDVARGEPVQGQAVRNR